LSVFIAGNLEAATYYIDGSKGKDSNPGSLASPWKTIGKANSTLQAGDIVYIRAGTYDNQYIAPTNSGSVNNYITYKNYDGEEAIITGGVYSGLTYTQIYLNSVSYIKLDGLRFYYPKYQWGFVKGSRHVKIENCVFDNVTGSSVAYDSFRIINSDYFQFVNTTWNTDDVPWKNGNIQNDLVSVFDISHFLFLNCTFGDASHASFGFTRGKGESAGVGPYVHEEGDYIVFKNCLFDNKWRSALGTWANQMRLLIDGCTFKQIGKANHQCPWEGDRNRVTPAMYSSTRYSVYRNNTVYGSDTSIFLRAGLMARTYHKCDHNWFYNNTLYDTDRCDGHAGGILRYAGCAIYGEAPDANYPIENNVFMNNIFWKIEGDALGRQLDVYGHGYPRNNTIKHNIFGNPDGSSIRARWNKTSTIAVLETEHEDWISGGGTHYEFDPLFVDPDAEHPDFALQESSPAIDSGTWLTTITSTTATDQTSITVQDATPFYSGSGAPWFIEGQSGDIIKTQDGQTTAILTINYDTNTITVSPAIDIIRGEGVALDYTGTAPDLGAHEYSGYRGISAPKNFKKE
jgi:hypothetical protein